MSATTFEQLLTYAPARPFTEGASVYAFAHSLSIILTYLRNELSSYKPSHVASNLTSVWADYARYEEVLISISDLYERVCPASNPVKSISHFST